MTRPTKNTEPPVRRKRRPLRRTTKYQSGIVISKWTRIRFYVVGCAITLCFMGVGYRAYGIQIEGQQHYRDLAERQHLRTVEVPAPRGNIYDRNGTELAVNADVDSVFANPRAIVDLVGASEKLSEVLELDIRTIEGRLASQRYFTWIKRHITPDQAEAVRALGIKGVSLTKEPRRYYPGKQLAGHVLGFAGIDGRGLDGLELAMDEVLTGEQARVASLRDASGGMMVDDPNAVPQAGASITLTLDRTIQFAAERAVREAVDVNKAKSAVAVVQDIHNGDILAIASYPDVDPNTPGKATSEGARNRAITDSYEVGSVMKVFSIAAALDDGVITPNTVIDTEKGRYRMGRKLYRDSFHDEELDIRGIIKRSSNVGALKIAQRLGAPKLHAAYRKFGFGSLTGIELPGEVAGVLHPAKRWGELGLNSHSFGYGMTSTPLQVTAAMAAIGNKGIYFEPRIIKQVTDGDGQALYRRTPKGRRVLSETAAEAIRPMLESVFEDGKVHGTARRVFVPGHRVGGKTGTAHKIDPATGKYGDHLYLSSFSGLAPIEDPRIAVTVLIDEPHGEEHYGGKVAGPAWARIVTETLAVLGLPSDAALLEEQLEAKRKLDRRFAWREGIDYDKLERQRLKNQIPLANVDEDGEEVPDEAVDPSSGAQIIAMQDVSADAPVDASLETDSTMVQVPDFTGMGMAKALAAARKAGISIEIKGSGSAIDQSLAPGPTRNPGLIRVRFTTSDHAFAER